MSNPEEARKWEGLVVDGKFPLRQWLGGSEHSAVFLTERPGQTQRITQKVAIKLIAQGSDAERQLSRWRAAGQLSHPHLMRIFEAGRCQVDGQSLLYLLMEYAEEDLSQILPQRALEPAEVTDLLPALLDALSYLHGKGFVHGRVKPSNVHAMGDQLKLSADEIVSVTGPHPARRRDVYDAPETADGIVSPPSDVWSIGVTLVAALTQNVSFVEEVAGTAAHRDPDSPAVPQPFRGIARECLHVDPKRRCSIAEIQARLQPAGRSVPAEPEALPPAKRRATRGPIFAVLLIAAVVVGFVLFHFRGKNAAAPATATSEQPTIQAPPVAAPAPAPNPPANQSIAPPTKAAATRGEVAHQVLPEVPQSARNTITGTIKVNVQVEVDTSGKVTSAKLTHPGPSEYFARLALKAAQQWAFTPPQVGGAPEASAWVIQFRFKRASTQASAQRMKR
ncbi:MAG: serine/threonine protein kinase [Candidatus Sulfotelmatobacter sp.]